MFSHAVLALYCTPGLVWIFRISCFAWISNLYSHPWTPYLAADRTIIFRLHVTEWQRHFSFVYCAFQPLSWLSSSQQPFSSSDSTAHRKPFEVAVFPSYFIYFPWFARPLQVLSTRLFSLLLFISHNYSFSVIYREPLYVLVTANPILQFFSFTSLLDINDRKWCPTVNCPCFWQLLGFIVFHFTGKAVNVVVRLQWPFSKLWSISGFVPYF